MTPPPFEPPPPPRTLSARALWKRLSTVKTWWLPGGVLLLMGGAVAAAFILRGWMEEGAALARQHAVHQVSHKGWSFPARLYARQLPPDAPFTLQLAEARARGYRAACPDPGPGQYCARTAKLVPRFGDVLEPYLLAWLVGPDGEVREHLPLDEAPRHLLDAIVVAEDREFFEHHGLNLRALVRAAWTNLREGSYAQGGSTLTMQVVRALNQRSEKTLWRKLRELGLALGVERALGKEGVLQMYLDAPYLGQLGGLSVSGFAAASWHYFNKDVRSLSIEEAATLAAILPAPARFSPHRFPELAKERRDRVLRALGELRGYDVEEALASPVRVARPRPIPERHPAYVSAVRAFLLERFPAEEVFGRGWRVETGLDLVGQRETEALFPQKLGRYESLMGKRQGPLQAAGVAVEVDTGLITAVYGGTDATATSFNRATQAKRQPGSSFKPLVYALAFEQRDAKGNPRYTAASTQPNAPRLFRTEQGNWSPRNVGGEYSETASLAQGLAWSQNIATASLLEELGGPDALIAFAQRLGVNTERFPRELGLALGQAEVTVPEMAQLTATFANGGLRVSPTPVFRAVDGAGVERLGPPTAGERVLSEEAAVLTRELMRLVVDSGTGGSVRGVFDEAGYAGEALGKTGTTDGEKDLWFIGATPRRAAVVWLGYDLPQSIGASASDLAAPLWGWWMRRLSSHDEGPPPVFAKEPKLERKAICSVTGQRANESCHALWAPFLPGTAPRLDCLHDHQLEREEAQAAGDAPSGHESLWKRLAREQAERAAQPQDPAVHTARGRR